MCSSFETCDLHSSLDSDRSLRLVDRWSLTSDSIEAADTAVGREISRSLVHSRSSFRSACRGGPGWRCRGQPRRHGGWSLRENSEAKSTPWQTASNNLIEGTLDHPTQPQRRLPEYPLSEFGTGVGSVILRQRYYRTLVPRR